MTNHGRITQYSDGTRSDSHAERCRLLWLKVIENALYDAMWRGKEMSECGYINERATYAEQADAWLRRKGRDFRTVCDLAGIDPDFLHDNYVAGHPHRDRP